MKNIKLILSLLITGMCFTATAQQEILESPDSIRKYLLQDTYSIDSNASAIVLSEKGTSSLTNGNLIYKVERIIKILKSSAIDEISTINISRYKYTSVTQIKASTFNLENGQIIRQNLEKADIFKDKIQDNFSVVKFNLPGVKEASLVYYTFTITNPGNIYVPEWEFQSQVPKLYSCYEASIPKYIVHTPLIRSNEDFPEVKNESDLQQCKGCYYTVDYGANLFVTKTMVRRNIPAFRQEAYMSSPDNYKERVKIHVSGVADRGYFVNIMNKWPDVINKYFYENDFFGKQVFAPNAFLKNKIKLLTSEKNSDLEKAKSIYYFVRDSITLTPLNTEWGNVKNTFESRIGNGLNKNLLLAAMLRKAGLDCSPMIITPKTEEKLNAVYPDINLNLEILCKLNIDRKAYFLDPSEKYMPFGVLFPQYYNGYARTVQEKSTEVTLNPRDIKDKTIILVSATPSADGSNLEFKMDIQFGTYTALGIRSMLAKDSTYFKKLSDTYVDNLDDNDSIKLEVKNKDNADLPLGLHSEGRIKMDARIDKVYLNLFFYKFADKNPFPDLERLFPIEFDYLKDLNYTFYLKLPESYSLDEIPQSKILKVGPDDRIQMTNMSSFNEADKTFAFNSRLTFKEAVFNPEDYNDIRSFFEEMLKEQNKNIILTKNPLK